MSKHTIKVIKLYTMNKSRMFIYTSHDTLSAQKFNSYFKRDTLYNLIRKWQNI